MLLHDVLGFELRRSARLDISPRRAETFVAWSHGAATARRQARKREQKMRSAPDVRSCCRR